MKEVIPPQVVVEGGTIEQERKKEQLVERLKLLVVLKLNLLRLLVE